MDHQNSTPIAHDMKTQTKNNRPFTGTTFSDADHMIFKPLSILSMILVLGGFFSFALSAQAGEFVEDANTLFLSHFDEKVDANVAHGNTEHVRGASGLTQGGGGKYGEAMICKSGMVTSPKGDSVQFSPLAFSLDDNMNLGKGTLEFWMKCDFSRTAQDPANPALYYLFDIPTKVMNSTGQLKRMVLVIRETSDGNRYFHFGFGTEGEKKGEDGHKIDWKADEWHHVAVTWDDVEGHLFLDGADVGTVPLHNGVLDLDRDACEGVFVVGGLQYSSPDQTFSGAIDEFRISDNVRYRDEFKPE